MGQKIYVLIHVDFAQAVDRHHGHVIAQAFAIGHPVEAGPRLSYLRMQLLPHDGQRQRVVAGLHVRGSHPVEGV